MVTILEKMYLCKKQVNNSYFKESMKRKIIQQLKLWKDNPARKPLILLGARQVGKTWVMKHFGLTEFENVAYINCDVEPLAKELFAADYNIPRILLTLQAITGTKIEAGKTLIVFDELQEVERGLHSLKYFQENAPEYHVMAAGSLLGITLGKGQSFPVGKVNVMHLYPMDFEEFLMAAGETDLCDLLHQPDWEILKILSLKYIDLLRQYYYVGGMPEVMDCFFQHQTCRKYVTNRLKSWMLIGGTSPSIRHLLKVYVSDKCCNPCLRSWPRRTRNSSIMC